MGDDTDKICFFTFCSELGGAPKEHPVFGSVSDSRGQPRAQGPDHVRDFRARHVCGDPGCVVSLYASGRSTGILMDSGGGAFHTVPN